MWPGTFAMKAIESNLNLSDFLKDYRYQLELTRRLDRLDSQPFTQAAVNEIILWKVNRYAPLSHLCKFNSETATVLVSDTIYNATQCGNLSSRMCNLERDSSGLLDGHLRLHKTPV